VVDGLLVAFGGIAAAIFVAELTDKDALLILALATRRRAAVVFLAGAVAFALSTGVIVAAGSLITSLVPILWVKVAGGVVMLCYSLWEARGLVGEKAVADDEARIREEGGGARAFLLMVGSLALLDIAGDATEVLTIVFVAQYSAALVFGAAYAALLAATGVETVLGSRLAKALTPARVRYFSVAVFALLGSSILIAALV
jgi:putative Ca2+/H+ antiporter (TMEM165/GDT1 family)